jgi:glutamyl-tRNA synthetase
MVEIEKDVIRAHALANAVKHDGKSNQGSVLAGLFSEGLEKHEIKNHVPIIKDILKEVNEMSLESQQEEIKKIKHSVSKREIREGLPVLENAHKGKVVLRFAPFPSGPLHIGNARQLILNSEYSKMYEGKIIMVIDDTIGSEAKPIEPKAYDLIEDGVKWLGVKHSKKIIYKSDRIETYYSYAEEMINKGYMYVCSCESEKMRENRAIGVECSCRNMSCENNLERWKKMFKAKEGSCCVRLKTSMSDPDPAFRDRVMFRISDRKHPRTKGKYRVYPLLDFSWAIDDHLLGITHIVRGKDLVMETRVEKFIWDIFKWEYPEVVHTGFLSIEGIKLSKSKGSLEVKSGEFRGWNDPRTWSLQSLKDRGILPRAIEEFIIGQGVRKSDATIPVDVLYTINKRLIEDSPRYFFVPSPVKIKINGTPKLIAKIPLHPSGKKGVRSYKTEQTFYISKEDFDLMENRDYRLMHLLNFKASRIMTAKPREFSFLSADPDDKLDVKYIQWLPGESDVFNVEVVMPDGSLVNGYGEEKLGGLKEGVIVQFERFGFVRLNKIEKNKLIFFFAHN